MILQPFSKHFEQIELDISTKSDDGRYTFKASAEYQQDKEGKQTGSAQVEARVNFGKNREKDKK